MTDSVEQHSAVKDLVATDSAEQHLAVKGLVATDSAEWCLVVKGFVAKDSVGRGFVACFRVLPAVGYLLAVAEEVVVVAALV